MAISGRSGRFILLSCKKHLVAKIKIYWKISICKLYFSCKLNLFVSDVPDSLSGSGSGWIFPFLSDIRIRPYLNLKKKFGSGSGRILIWKKNPDPGPADSDLVSKKELTEKFFFLKQTLSKLKRVILYRSLYIC